MTSTPAPDVKSAAGGVGVAPDGARFTFMEVPRARLQRRHHVMAIAFVLTVIVPVLLTAIHVVLLSDQAYEIRNSVILQSERHKSALGGSKVSLASTSGQDATDRAITRALIGSRDFMEAVNDRIPLASIWPEDKRYALSPYPYRASDPVEKRLKFWQRMVWMHVGTRDEILRIYVRSFSDEDGKRLLEAVISTIEDKMRVLTQDMSLHRVATLEKQMQLAQDTVNQSLRKLDLWRNDNHMLDPQALARVETEVAQKLRIKHIEAALRLSQSVRAAGDDSILAARARTQAQSLERATNERRGTISVLPDEHGDTRSAAGGITVTPAQIEEYTQLRFEQEIAQKRLMATRAAYETERNSTIGENLYAATYSGRSALSAHRVPGLTGILLAVAGTGFLLWFAAVFVFYAVRDRK